MNCLCMVSRSAFLLKCFLGMYMFLVLMLFIFTIVASSVRSIIGINDLIFIAFCYINVW